MLLYYFRESGEGGIHSAVAVRVIGYFFLPFGVDKLRQLRGYWLHGVRIVEARKSGKITHLTFDIRAKIRELLQIIVFSLIRGRGVP